MHAKGEEQHGSAGDLHTTSHCVWGLWKCLVVAVMDSFDAGLLPRPFVFVPFSWVWILSFAIFLCLF